MITLPEAESDEEAAPKREDVERAVVRASLVSTLIAMLLRGGPVFRWDRKRLAYIDARANLVPPGVIAKELEKVRAAYRGKVVMLSEALASSTPTEARVLSWMLSLRDELKAMHATAAGIGKGGLYPFTPSDFRELGALTREQYRFLENFGADVLMGKQRYDGRFYQRAKMYVDQSRRTFFEIRRSAAREAGFGYERNVLHPADHCDECVELSEMGFVQAGTLPAPGERTCVTSCRCELEFAEVIQ